MMPGFAYCEKMATFKQNRFLIKKFFQFGQKVCTIATVTEEQDSDALTLEALMLLERIKIFMHVLHKLTEIKFQKRCQNL